MSRRPCRAAIVPGLVHQAEDCREVEPSRLECPLSLVRKAFERVGVEPSTEWIDRPDARTPGRPRAQKPDRLVEIAGRREDARVRVCQSDPSPELFIGLDEVRGYTGNDLVDRRQDQVDDRADRVAVGHVSRAHGHRASVAVGFKATTQAIVRDVVSDRTGDGAWLVGNRCRM